MKTIRLLLGDQLNINHSWFKEVNNDVTYVLMEIRTETDYVWHHIQKIAGFFTAMRNFKDKLLALNHQVIYFTLNDANNQQCFEKNLLQLIAESGFDKFEYLLPDEYRVDQVLKNFVATLSIRHSVQDTEHFLTSRTELGDFFNGKKTFIMERFYQYMRKKHNVLMEDSDPLTGKWNYDEDNRKKLPTNHVATIPLTFDNDVSDVVDLIINSGIKTIGTINAKDFIWPVTREQCLELLDFFVDNCLPLFGTYQDAMTPHEWSLYHSRLSFAMNTKQLAPGEVIQRAIQEWIKRPQEIQYNQLEGFVRQIIGWREYMRGIYWLKMPEFASMNYLDNKNVLPEWYWTGNTKMNCLKFSINQSLNFAYAHHIQRLMITGNFALLAGVHPDEVDAWYLGIYIDALQWVEITNTRGMSQFADGGIIGTKPYVSSAAYINKMSHYCGSCYYDKSKKTGERACPFNSLYWNFYDQHKNKLLKNPRISMMYRIWEKMPAKDHTAILEQAKYYLDHINEL